MSNNKPISFPFLFIVLLIYAIAVLVLIEAAPRAVLLSTTSIQPNLDGAMQHNAAQQIDAKQERTLILIKPDGVQRKLVGKIIDRFENKGLKLVGVKLVLATKDILDEHYNQHKNKPFHDMLIEFMSSSPLAPMIWEGPNAVRIARNLLGNYDPFHSEPGTIRGDFCIDMQQNVIHGSDSVEAANKEIKLWFNENEIIS